MTINFEHPRLFKSYHYWLWRNLLNWRRSGARWLWNVISITKWRYIIIENFSCNIRFLFGFGMCRNFALDVHSPICAHLMTKCFVRVGDIWREAWFDLIYGLCNSRTEIPPRTHKTQKRTFQIGKCKYTCASSRDMREKSSFSSQQTQTWISRAKIFDTSFPPYSLFYKTRWYKRFSWFFIPTPKRP